MLGSKRHPLRCEFSTLTHFDMTFSLLRMETFVAKSFYAIAQNDIVQVSFMTYFTDQSSIFL